MEQINDVAPLPSIPLIYLFVILTPAGNNLPTDPSELFAVANLNIQRWSRSQKQLVSIYSSFRFNFIVMCSPLVATTTQRDAWLFIEHNGVQDHSGDDRQHNGMNVSHSHPMGICVCFCLLAFNNVKWCQPIADSTVTPVIMMIMTNVRWREMQKLRVLGAYGIENQRETKEAQKFNITTQYRKNLSLLKAPSTLS